jgi:hypothetical protein
MLGERRKLGLRVHAFPTAREFRLTVKHSTKLDKWLQRWSADPSATAVAKIRLYLSKLADSLESPMLSRAAALHGQVAVTSHLAAGLAMNQLLVACAFLSHDDEKRMMADVVDGDVRMKAAQVDGSAQDEKISRSLGYMSQASDVTTRRPVTSVWRNRLRRVASFLGKPMAVFFVMRRVARPLLAAVPLPEAQLVQVLMSCIMLLVDHVELLWFFYSLTGAALKPRE